MAYAPSILHAILDQTKDLVVAIDADFRLLVINSAYAAECLRLYGRTPACGDDVRIGENYLFPGKEGEQAWARALAGEEFIQTWLVDASEFVPECYEFRYAPLQLESGAAAVQVGRRITENTQYESRAQARVAELEARLEQQVIDLDRLRFSSREWRERLAVALSVSDIGTFRYDVRRQVGYWDERLLHYFGFSQEDRARSVDEFMPIVHPDDRAEVRVQLELAGQRLGPMAGVFRIVRAGREICWLQYRAQVFPGADGQPAEMIGACTDVTRLKQAEHEIKARERQIRELADHMPVIVWSQRQDLSLEYINQGWRDYTGLNLEDTPGGGWRQVVHPDDLPRVDATVAAAVKAGRLFEVECRFLRVKDSRYRWHLVRCLPVLDQHGKPVRWYGTAVDIEERIQIQQKWEQVRLDLQRTNEELVRSLAQLEGVLGSMSEGMMLFNAEGELQSMNAAARSICGLPAGLKVDQRSDRVNWFDLRNLDNTPVSLQDWPSIRALKGDVISDQEYFLRRVDTGEQWIGSFNAAPVHDHGGELIFAVLTFRNVTERRATEQALQAAVDARDRFLSIASHELRTPLTTLTMQLQMARRRVDPETDTAPNPQELAKMLDTANRQTGRLTKLVDDLLDVSRSGLDRLEFRPQPTNLSQIVAETCAQFDAALHQAGCELSCSLEPDVIGLWDGDRLEQVVGNLLSNAIKYAAGTEIQVTLQQKDGEAILMIRDHGPGIPSMYRSRIFERFARFVSDSAVTGLGLGLFLTHEIIAGHGGRIELQEVEGPGACFVITLPQQPEELRHHGHAVPEE